jgi:ataxia telangiectasia mutated family protein
VRSFDEICGRFMPVFRHFFLESYRHPSDWFERRLAYTRSVAVNSMVGYIIGLGDRHSSNILLHLQSAEVGWGTRSPTPRQREWTKSNLPTFTALG